MMKGWVAEAQIVVDGADAGPGITGPAKKSRVSTGITDPGYN